MNIAAIPRSRPAPKARWFVPAGLILLSLVPILAGTLRLTQLAGGKITPENARFL
jgi:hypothetical protein